MDGQFRDRALHEAARYGSDPWVFVRELLQNARDASATRAVFEAEERDGVARVACRDDGEGMTFAHARAFLFTLYASSKEGKRDTAGRFGVGFWSILRFEPARIVIRSWPKGSEPWEVALDGKLARAVRRTPPPGTGTGTQIVLERPAGDGQLARRVSDAVFQNARFLGRRDDARTPLAVTVNGVVMNAAFELPAPSASFRRGRVRGVVGLGSQTRVELFSKGLRVRSAAFLDDLLSPPGRTAGHARVRFPELADGLAPQALLESGELELLLSRSDAREDRALRKVVRLARRELARLIERQLDLSRPEPFWRRVLAAPAGMITAVSLGLLAGAALIALVPAWVAPPAQGPAAALGLGAGGAANGGQTSAGATSPAGYRDLTAFYEGPRVDVLDAKADPIALRYEPAQGGPLHLAALIVERLQENGLPAPEAPVAGTRYAGPDCAAGGECVSFAMPLSGAQGQELTRIPVPTGHRLDPRRVTIDGVALEIFATASDQPAFRSSSPSPGTLRWQSAPATPRGKSAATRSAGPSSAISFVANRLRRDPEGVRVRRATEWVRGAIRYSNDRAIEAEHLASVEDGTAFIERSLAIGAGDCDVQNGVLMRLLQETGIPARLAIGYVGAHGTISPWLHAWVEYRIGDGPWQVADASEGSAAATVAAARDTPAPRDTHEDLAAVGLPPVTHAGQATPRGGITRNDLPRRRMPGTVGALLLFFLALGGAAFVLLRRTRREVRLDRSHDLSRLLQGALEQPGAFQHAPSLFVRRLVPCAGGRAISLGEAWELAARGRLYCTRVRPPLARRAARAGAVVLDRTRPEGIAVADALGAIDLDAWASLFGRARRTPLLDAMNGHLSRAGETWNVFGADGVASPAILEIPEGSGWLPGFKRTRHGVVLDLRASWLADAAARPAPEAALAALDRVADVLDLPAARRARLLAPLARAAVLAAGSGSGRGSP